MGAIKEVSVPDIGDFKEVDVIEVLVKPGDAIHPEQSLITVESDKATMEIPSSDAGVVKELRVKIGDKVSRGTPILLIEASAPASSSAPEKTLQSGASRPAQPAPPRAQTPVAATRQAAEKPPVPTPTPARPATVSPEAVAQPGRLN